jgi:hypothetical protein
MAGGSLANIPKILLSSFYSAISGMKFVNGNTFSDAVWKLENKGKAYLFYAKNSQDISINLSAYKGDFEVYVINASTGNFIKKTNISGGKKVAIPASDVKEKVLFVVESLRGTKQSH